MSSLSCLHAPASVDHLTSRSSGFLTGDMNQNRRNPSSIRMLRDRAGAYTLANLRLQRSANQPLDRFLSELGSVGRVGIVGGAVRDWFLTADAIVVDAENGETFDAGFFDCFVRRELDVLSDHLPFGLAVTAVARSLVLSDEHALSISSRLSQFICRAAARGIRWPLIEKEQFERYGRVLVTGSEARYLLRSSPNAFRELVAEAAAHPRGFTQAA